MGQESVLYSFSGGTDGQSPAANLINIDGTLYGTTGFGGIIAGESGYGTVYQIKPSGKERVLYSLQGGLDGAVPQAGLLNVNGELYGTTFEGGAYGPPLGDEDRNTVV